MNEASLRALLRKYETLAALRVGKRAGEAPPEKSVFVALAREFPGALKELDTLPLATIVERIESLTACIESESEALPWMRAIESYHRWMRVALAVKRRTSAGALTHEAIAAAVSRKYECVIELEFVRQIESPPGGKIKAVVLDRVARELGVAMDTLTL